MLTRQACIRAGLGVLMMTAMAATAQAGTRGGLYDMNAMINEVHPFAASGQGPMPATLAPAMTPIAPPAPTLRYTPPPRPPMATAQAGAKTPAQPYRPFGEDTGGGWFNGFYIAAGGGLNLPNDLDGSTAAGATFSIASDPGFLVQGAFGTHLGENFRVEAEAAYRMADYDQASAGGTTVTPTGDLKMATGMVNLYYDIDLGSFTPFVGAGAGVARIKSTAITIGTLSVVEKNATEFAYQAIIGVSYEISRDWSIGLDGRYLGTSDEDVSATAVTLNVRYNL